MSRRGTRIPMEVRWVAAAVVAVALVGGPVHFVAPAAADPTSQRDIPQAQKVCVGTQFATFGAVYEAIFDSFTPILPASVRATAPAAKARALADMDKVGISSLLISNHPAALGASADAPINKYRDPLSQWIVTQLLNVRNGTVAQPISLKNLTLSQAVESAWLYIYLTVIIPLTVVKGTLPSFYSLGPISVGTLITLPITLGTTGLTFLYDAISDGLLDACLVNVTPEEQQTAGLPASKLTFTDKVPPLIRDLAGSIAIAEPDTCPAIGNLPLSDIVTRTSHYLAAITGNAAFDKQLARDTKNLLRFMRGIRVPHNLIPADPADFSTIEKLLSMGLGLLPYVGGAATDAGIGIGDNVIHGKNLIETVPLTDLTVTKGFTAAYYSYALTTQLISVLNDLAASALTSSTGGFDLLPRLDGIINVPNTYGLVVAHNVIRSLCFTDPDISTGTQPTLTQKARW